MGKAQEMQGLLGVATLADAIFRRTSLGMAESPEYLDREGCATIMAQEPGWSPTKVPSEVEETRSVLIRSLQSL